MGTHHDLPPASDDAERGVARLLRDGNREPLARAKENLKDRLLRQLSQEAVQELQDVSLALPEPGVHAEELSTLKEDLKVRLRQDLYQQTWRELADEGVGEAPAEAVEHLGEETWEAAQRDARAELKRHFRERLIEDALSEIRHEAEAGKVFDEPARAGELEDIKEVYLKQPLRERLVASAVEEIREESQDGSMAIEASLYASEALQEIKEQYKARLLEDLLQQAIDEIGDEVHAAPAPAAPVDLPQEPPPAPAGAEARADAPAAPYEAPQEVSEPEALEGGEEEGFFLSSSPVPSGNGSVDASADPNGDGPWFSLDAASVDASPLEDAAAAPDPWIDEWDGRALDGDGHEDPSLASDEAICYYLYGVFTREESLYARPLPPLGIDAVHPLYSVSHDQIHAVISKVPVLEFSPEALETNLLDPDWREQHAQTHGALVKQLGSDPAFLPLPAFTVFEHLTGIKAMLEKTQHLDALEKLKSHNQWKVRVFKNRETLHQQVVENSEAVQGLMAEIKSKKGGAELKKKMVATIQEEMAFVTDSCTKDVHDRLLGWSKEATLGLLEDGDSQERGELMLDVTYLLHDDHALSFQQDLDYLVDEYAALGFEIVATGPFPPTLHATMDAAPDA